MRIMVCTISELGEENETVEEQHEALSKNLLISKTQTETQTGTCNEKNRPVLLF